MQHKLDNADIINNIKGSDYGIPQELLIEKKPFNSDAIVKKSGQSETSVPDRSKEALKKHWESKRIVDVTTFCQPGGSKDSTVVVAEKTQNGFRFAEKTIEKVVKRVEVENVVVERLEVERLEVERPEAEVPPIGTIASQDIYGHAVVNMLKDQENIVTVRCKFWL